MTQKLRSMTLFENYVHSPKTRALYSILIKNFCKYHKIPTWDSMLQLETNKLKEKIEDWERESPAFKEAVKIMITPMITSLSILNYVDMDSEDSVLGYGISLIVLNLGMYFVAPGIVIYQIRKKL